MKTKRLLVWLFSLLGFIFLFIALLGAFGIGIFPIHIKPPDKPDNVNVIIVSILLSLLFVFLTPIRMQRFEVPSRSKRIRGLAKTLGITLCVLFVLFVLSSWIPQIRFDFSRFLFDLWNNLPTVAQISPYVSITLSLASFVLALLTYRIQLRKDDRDTDEYLSRKAERESKIVRPNSEEIEKYTKNKN
jgi:hypothetical protein